MKQLFLGLLGIFIIHNNAQAQGFSDNYKFSPVIESVFPLYAGGGLKLRLYNNFEIGASYGVTPKAYYTVIGNAAAHFGDNSSYKEVVEAAFQDNSLWHFNLQYNFQGQLGWNLGGAGSFISSSGQAGIDTVLGASTGQNYSQLRNLLVALHRDPNVSMDSKLTIAEIYGGYTWDIGYNINTKFTFGVAKVLNADVKIKTGLPNYEASVAGSTLLRTSESDIEDIIKENGITPTMGLSFSYEF